MDAGFLCGVEYRVLARNDTFDDDIINPRPQQIHINAHLLKMFTKGTQRPLVPEIILLTRLIRNELIILLIDRVVRQMHELILLVDLLGVRF